MQIHRLNQLLASERPLRFVPGTPAEHRSWSGRVRDMVDRLARANPQPPAVAASETVIRDGLSREQLLFHSEGRGRFHGTVLAPARPGRHPAVLVLAGKNARLDMVTGTEPPDFPDRNMAEHLARAGFTTLTFDYGIDAGLDSGRLAGRPEGALLAHAFALRGHSLLGSLLSDALAALAWLRGHPRADAQRTGIFGHSLGGAIALHTALLSPQPLPVCVASHLGGYPALFTRLLTGYEGAVLPGILEYADLPDLFAALAPAPLHLQYGLDDRWLDPADARRAAETVRRAYAAAGAGDRVEVLELAMGHGTDPGLAAGFFARALERPVADPAPVPAQLIRFHAEERRRVLDGVDQALASGVLTQGPQVARFESLTRDWTGREGVALNSGAAALEIALRVLGVAGRTVLIPVNTFFATAAAAVRAGAAVRFVDLELDGLGMDPAALREALDRHREVAAVIPVHIGGVISPALDEVLAECRDRGVPVLEDAAHALGSTLDGRPAGALGRLGAFSFFPTKVATSGEGGLLTGADPDQLEQARRWRDHGKTAPGSTLHDRPGGNWRMSELHAALGNTDLERFGTTLEARRALAARYDTLLREVPGVRPYAVPAQVACNFYKYLVFLDRPVDRAELKNRLRERHGVSAAGEVYDTLLCDQPFFAGVPAGEFPRARWFAGRHLALPVYPAMTEAEQLRVVAALRSELL
ncbi:DegT/DnrJ/EryC1/StrS family aminotransferase [Streptomyces sp. NPDC052396]|uniref:DegT/DnrJ/EryC1/StrS family aminotransferase n=1 Tax=Streptomyces sp. NPDC052396 TaxID=3365689 RepID=UPI0037CF5864